MQCPFCHIQAVVKNGKYSLRDGSQIQHHLCKACAQRFRQKTGTPMAGLRTSTELVAIALRMRGEGMGVRASSRVLDKSHSTILRWEERMAKQASQWSPAAPRGGDVTLESDELYTRVGENLPPL
jgi:transposase-like protein